MRVTYNAKQSQVTVKLTWAETRQFMSSTAAVEVVREAIRKTVDLAAPLGGVDHFST